MIPTAIFPPTELPEKSDDPDFSIDVFILHDNGFLDVGYYSFELKRWKTHIENYNDANFKWFYRPI
jgi:hypothetical protein